MGGHSGPQLLIITEMATLYGLGLWRKTSGAGYGDRLNSAFQLVLQQDQMRRLIAIFLLTIGLYVLEYVGFGWQAAILGGIVLIGYVVRQGVAQGSAGGVQ